MTNKARMKSYSSVLFSALLPGLLFAAPAHAERADRDKPVQLEADRATVDDATQTSVFTGNVVLTQGSLVIRAGKMTVKQDAGGFQNASALGNPASFRQKREGLDEYVEGWGERMEYDSKADKLQLFGQARLKRGRDEVSGNYISYDAISEFFQVTGGKDLDPARRETATKTSPEGRVRAVIQPKKRD